jgi:hypothetical protein
MAVLGLVSRRKSSVRWFVLVGLVGWSAGWAVPLWGRSACPVFRWAAFAPGAQLPILGQSVAAWRRR